MRNLKCVIPTVCLFILICGAQIFAQTPNRAKPNKPATVKRDAAPIKLRPRPVESILHGSDLVQIAINGNDAGDLTPGEKRQLAGVISHLKKNDTVSAESTWKKLAGSMFIREGAPIRAKVVNYVLHESYIETNKDLKYRAEKVRFYNAQKEAAFKHRKLLQGHRDTLKKSNNRGETVRVEKLRLAKKFTPGAAPVLSGAPADQNVDSVVDELSGIVVLCDHAEENSTNAQLELQGAMKKQNRTYLTMSNVMKMLRDTAKNAIQNVR